LGPNSKWDCTARWTTARTAGRTTSAGQQRTNSRHQNAAKWNSDGESTATADDSTAGPCRT